MASGIRVEGSRTPSQDQIVTTEALDFVAHLQREIGPAREDLLERRVRRLEDLGRGVGLGFLEHTEAVRESSWQVASAPPDLTDRRVEITGPVERKMMINALNSGASVFMADFEDALSPTWTNVVEGQANLIEAVRRRLTFTSPEGKEYRLYDRTPTMVVRPRGWHLTERHVNVDGQPVSASLFDFGLYFFHNAAQLLKRATAPSFYLAKPT